MSIKRKVPAVAAMLTMAGAMSTVGATAADGYFPLVNGSTRYFLGRHTVPDRQLWRTGFGGLP